MEHLRVPKDLAQVLAANPAAGRNFAALSPSAKKMVLRWVISARLLATRTRRITETVSWAGSERAL